MMAKRHALVTGVGWVVLGVLAMPPTDVIVTLPAAVVAALGPDLDHPKALISNSRHPLQRRARRLRRLRHRDLGQNVELQAVYLLLPFAWIVTGLGRIVQMFCRHRGPTHSILSIFTVYLAVLPASGVLATAVGAGWAAHIAEDMLTDGGCELLWPIYRQRIKMPGLRWVKTGSWSEIVMAFVAIGAILATGWYRIGA